MDGTVSFTPDFSEKVGVVKEFNTNLKYVKFLIVKNEAVGLMITEKVIWIYVGELD